MCPQDVLHPYFQNLVYSYFQKTVQMAHGLLKHFFDQNDGLDLEISFGKVENITSVIVIIITVDIIIMMSRFC